MQFTSASAGKYLKALQDEKDFILSEEAKTCVFTRSADEALDPPHYDFAKTSERIASIDEKMRVLRHALHVFNAHALVEPHGITVDEALIYLAQLNNEKLRLDGLRRYHAKERIVAAHREAVEYRYANYDVEQAQRDYELVVKKVSDLQLAIDLCNQTKTFEADV